jgi:hypothetical protein
MQGVATPIDGQGITQESIDGWNKARMIADRAAEGLNLSI